jgi:predicted DNA repair protein MutK
LLALLDDVAAIAKVAAASLDDVAAQTAKAGSKAMGIVIDDAAVTPRYVVGFAAERELPIVGKIAMGSLRNKLVFLLPGALMLSYLAPWAITPLLMAGGVFLCFEGYEKVHELIAPHDDNASPAEAMTSARSAQELEDQKVAGAIRTDIILSAEIMAIALSSVQSPSFLTKAGVLAAVGLSITVFVYGAVALIVKADDFGAALARGRSAIGRLIGRGLVLGMPDFLRALSIIGMLAMLWVGGGILIHGLYEFGVKAPEHAMLATSRAAAAVTGPFSALAGWLAGAVLAGALGIVIGWIAAVGVGALARIKS